MKNSTFKKKNIEKLMKSIISSLVSHLPYTYLKSYEGKKFHTNCVKQYAKDIKDLSEIM